MTITQEQLWRRMEKHARDLLANDGGDGSECYHAMKLYDARKALQDVLAESISVPPSPTTSEVEKLQRLLRLALPCVESEAQMMDAMDRHAPLPEADMPAITAAANNLDALVADIRAALTAGAVVEVATRGFAAIAPTDRRNQQE